MKTRKAVISDIKEIQKLVNAFARRELIIPRAINELYENIRDFVVVEEKGDIKGVCALHVLWEDLAEVRSLAVRKEYQKLGIGKHMVKKCLSEAKALGIKRVIVLTYQPAWRPKALFFRSTSRKKPWLES